MTMLQSSNKPGESRQDRDARAIAWIAAIFSAVSAFTYLYLALHIGAWQLVALTIDHMVLVIASWICLGFVTRKQINLGINILLWVGQLTFIAGSALIADTGWLWGLGVMLCVIAITAETIRPEKSQYLLFGGVISGLIAFFVDAYNAGDRLVAPQALLWALIGFIGVVSLIYVVLFISRFNSYSLQIKLIAATIGLISTPLMILGYIQTNTIRARTITETGAELTTLANQAALTLDSFFNDNLTAIRIDAQQPDFPKYLSELKDGNLTDETKTETLQALRILAKKNPIFISSYAVLDSNGIDSLDSNSSLAGLDESQQEYFKTAISGGLPYASSLLYQADTKSTFLFFSSPIRDVNGTTIGVLRAKYSGSTIQQTIIQYNKLSKSDSYVAVLDENHIFVAHSLDPQLILKSADHLSASQLKDFQSRGLLPTGNAKDTYANLEGLSEGLANIDQHSIFTAETDVTFNGSPDYVATSKMKSRNWVVLLAEPEAEFLSTVRDNTINTALLVALVTLLSTIGTFVLARVMASPLTHLTETAIAVAEGNLNVFTKIETEDEVGTLAKAFDTMTLKMREMVATLEQRVADRTQDLEKQTVRMRVAAEVARDAASARDLNELLERSSRLILNRFNFYHTGIFLTDETREYAVLRASPTEAGQAMLKNNHRLKIGEQGIVGTVAATGEPRIALDTGEDPVHFSNPLLPDTRSEMALPLKSNAGVIGILDVQSDQPNAFSLDDIAILQIMADQLATAIERTQLLQQVESNLQELEKAYSEFTQRSWNTFLGGELYTPGYRYNNIRMESIREVPKEAKKALETGVTTTLKDESTNEASIPIRLRGQTIGVVNIRFQGNYTPQETINLVEQTADRLASALENARLVEETRQRSQRDVMVTEVSGRMRSTLDLETVLRTAAQELQQAFQLKQAEVYLGITEPMSDKNPPKKINRRGSNSTKQ